MIRTLFRWLILLAILADCACASVEHRRTDEVTLVCASATAALQTLTIANEHGKLTPAEFRAIGHAGDALLPVCGANAHPTADSLKGDVFHAAVIYLALEAGKLK